MGGTGSGRRGGGRCTDDMRPLDVRQLYRTDLLKPGNSLSWSWSRDNQTTAAIDLRVEADRVFLMYGIQQRRDCNGEAETMDYPVYLDWTPCPMGGRRVWWLCPVPGCGRRVAVLHGGRVFACRHCHRLAYRSQRETEDDRVVRRVKFIRQRLGWEGSILKCSGDKPKWMHWRRYDRLKTEHDTCLELAVVTFTKTTALLRDRIEAIGAGLGA